MKNKLLLIATVGLMACPKVNFAQAPNLGTAATFVLFSTDGAVGNTGLSNLTGNVGTGNGSSTGFGNVNGVMHDNDGASAQATADLQLAFNYISSMTPTFAPGILLGNGDTLHAGVNGIPAATTLNLDLVLDAQGNSSALFIFQIGGSFATGASAKVKLINGAKACNVFWAVSGSVNMATGTSMKGNIIANNSAIVMNSLDTLEGRAFAIAGAITVDGVLAYTPIGCNSPILMGPVAPALGSTECYALFSSDGSVTNAGITTVLGDVGTNVGLTTGFDSSNVTGNIHSIPDGSTAACGADLLNVYNYLNLLPYDIELLYPAQFGRNLVLTPHTYLLGAATVFTDTLYLNAQNEPDAVFVIQINGALSTSVYSKVILINSAQAKNVYWKINGAVAINDYSIFNGSVVSTGAIDITTGVTLNGRAQTTVGTLTTAAINASNPGTCLPTSSIANVAEKKVLLTFAPNPFNSNLTVLLNDVSLTNKATLRIYNTLGEEVMNTYITKQSTNIETSNLVSGIYFYTLTDNNKTIQSGKLVSQK